LTSARPRRAVWRPRWIGRFVGQRKLSITADTYTHVLSDGREVDLAGLLEQAR
jgi:hypothetical protein